MPDDVRHMTDEQLKAEAAALKRQRQAKPKPVPLFPNATTATVLKIMDDAEAILLQLRSALSQWEANLLAVGDARMARGDLKSRAVGE